MSTGEFSRATEDAYKKLTEALSHVISSLFTVEAVDGAAGSVSDAVNELDGLVHTLHSLYENQIHRLDHKHTQLKADSEQRDTSTAKLLRGLEEENERLVETNQALLAELGELRTRCRRVETSLKERVREVGVLAEQLMAQQEHDRLAAASGEERAREVEGREEEWRWRVREEERVRGERERELDQSRDMERTLRATLTECRHQLEHTHQELQRTQQELQSTETTLANTNEELNTLKHQLQPKEEELQALQERIAERAQQLMELLDRRSGDYSRQVQEEIVSQSRAYDHLLKKVLENSPSSTSEGSPGSMSPDTPLSPSRPLDVALCLRDFLNPHLLPTPTPSPSSPSSPSSHSTSSDGDGVVTAQQRYLNTFTDFTQRVRVGEYRVCPKSRLRLYRLQQWRHHFMEITLRPAPPLLKVDECSMCDVVSLMKGVAKKLGVVSTSLLLYSVERSRTRGPTSVRLWVLRKALGPTLQYEVDSLLSNLSLSGHHMIFVSLADPLGTPSPMEQWEAAHHRVVGRLEESPMADVVAAAAEDRGAAAGDGRVRTDSMDMVDLEPATTTQPTSQLLMTVEQDSEEHIGGHGSRQVGVARRAGFHIKALVRLMCTSCLASSHGNHSANYRHLEEIHSNS